MSRKKKAPAPEVTEAPVEVAEAAATEAPAPAEQSRAIGLLLKRNAE